MSKQATRRQLFKDVGAASAVTMRDIASDLGVSLDTVSKVLRNKDDIGEAMRKRVLDRVKELGYTPNLAARGLATGKTYLVGLVVPDLLHPLFAQVAKSLSRILLKKGYCLTISTSEEDAELEKHQINRLLRRQLDALIIATSSTDPSIFARIHKQRLPLVLIDRNLTGLDANYVGTDDEAIGFLATEHIIEVGCKKIAHLRGPDNSPGAGRLKGYQNALAKHGLTALSGYVSSPRLADVQSRESGAEMMRQLLALSPRPDGVFCFNDPIAIGAIQAALDAGLRVPADVAIIGSGNLHHDTELRIPLSSVDQQTASIGEQAGRLILSLLESKTPQHSKTIIIQPQLVIRASTNRGSKGQKCPAPLPPVEETEITKAWDSAIRGADTEMAVSKWGRSTLRLAIGKTRPVTRRGLGIVEHLFRPTCSCERRERFSIDPAAASNLGQDSTKQFLLHYSGDIMSTIGFECQTRTHSPSSRLRKICLVAATVGSCVSLLCLGTKTHASAISAQEKAVNTPGKDNPEEQVDVDYHETNLIPITPAASIVVLSVHKIDEGAVFRMRPGVMKVQLCSDNIVHVSYAPGDEPPTDASLAVIGCHGQPQSAVRIVESLKDTRLVGDKLVVAVTRSTGALTFLTPEGNRILAEPQNGGKAMEKATVNQEETYHLQQEFISPPDEALYGLAEGQDGVWNWRGMPVDLISQNITGAFPVMVSSRGYALIWDNESLTEFNPVSENEEISLNPSSRSGVFTAQSTGDYVFFARGGDGARDIGIAVGSLVTHDDNNMWVPYTSVVKAHLTAGEQYPVRLLGGGKAARLYGRLLGNTSVFRSEVGNDISYYFVYGPSIDKVVAGYRQLTGTAPLFPKWAYGFWQCREHYASQQETLDAAEGFRSRHIPVDLIVQDWQYWGKWGWGAYRFDPTAYPDPAEMIKKLHKMEIHYMISVWADPKGEVLDELAKHHGEIEDSGYVNELSSEGRSIRWQYLKRYMFDIGVDAWWQDGEEANGQVRNHKVYVDNLGLVSGNPYTYYYPQAANESIYEGQRAADPAKRVVQLGKTATLGFQRYAAVTWSGDIRGSWQALSQQIPAGLNLSIGGMPYWTTDTGGFFRPTDQYSSQDYNRLLIRWFEYSTFCPILRIHGFKTETEIWKWPLAYKDLLMYDNFRYRMLPYIYSQAWQVTHDNDTMMRPLVMDFQRDRNVDNIGDQYMFGSAFMVAPITTAADGRSVYLPKGTQWTNFWTGQSLTGGQHLNVEAPLEQIPLFIRPGAILPLGPVVEYAAQKSDDPIEVRVYPGANGSFVLYEDENDNYNYEKGVYATIQFTWNDASQTLTIGRRNGEFPGMSKEKTFAIVVVRPGHGTGLDKTPQADQIVSYSGSAETVHLRVGKK